MRRAIAILLFVLAGCSEVEQGPEFAPVAESVCEQVYECLDEACDPFASWGEIEACSAQCEPYWAGPLSCQPELEDTHRAAVEEWGMQVAPGSNQCDAAEVRLEACAG